jgi:hypothetical protein
MIDIEGRLASAGESWRAAQPGPPEPDPDRLDSRRHNRWPMAAAAAAVALVIAGTVLVLRSSPRLVTPVDPSTRPSATGSPVVSRPPAALVVRDGDTVEATGIVRAEPGNPIYFCSPFGASVGDQPACTAAIGLPATGVDLNRLTHREEHSGAVFGRAWLRGVLRDGAIDVIAQAPPREEPGPWHLPEVLKTTPCPPPGGGWRGSIDNDAIQQYVEARASRFNGIGISRPAPGVEVIVVGVSAGDVPAAQNELRAKFGPNICAVIVAYTAAAQRRARTAVEQLMRDGEYWIQGIGCACGFTPVIVQVTMLNQRSYDLLQRIGFDQLELWVWLKPVP